MTDWSSCHFHHYEDGAEKTRCVEIDSFHIEHGSVGTPDSKWTPEAAYEAAHRRAIRFWGDRPTLLVEPTTPRAMICWIVYVYLLAERLEPRDGRQLVMIFFLPKEAIGNTIRSLVAGELHGLKWNDYAANCHGESFPLQRLAAKGEDR